MLAPFPRRFEHNIQACIAWYIYIYIIHRQLHQIPEIRGVFSLGFWSAASFGSAAQFGSAATPFCCCAIGTVALDSAIAFWSVGVFGFITSRNENNKLVHKNKFACSSNIVMQSPVCRRPAVYAASYIGGQYSTHNQKS